MNTTTEQRAKEAPRNFDIILKAAIDKAFHESGLYALALNGSDGSLQEKEKNFFNRIDSDVVSRVLERFNISLAASPDAGDCQSGTSLESDFEAGTWTFKMDEPFFVMAGRFKIVPIPLRDGWVKPIKQDSGKSWSYTKIGEIGKTFSGRILIDGKGIFRDKDGHEVDEILILPSPPKNPNP